ncbi:helix-turn-helix domain-containing protein [Gemmatimonas sp.]|uniref:helix-turn-helix domain-containing protein n=1 Tax=Gemmatimonas sp. TaxID=1962908 RepID=UPI0022BE520E|nr:helix-turn-helix domain-containing protein [Gemmatimonas sp.]MCZ8203404.1 helix-turn-helix domain-containing protein [Gemmatimonas sp.]
MIHLGEVDYYNATNMPRRSTTKQSQLRQLDELVVEIKPSAADWPVPDGGWIASIRDALGMTGEQLGRRLGITRSSVRALELRERDGGATLEALRATAAVLGCDFVYALIPKTGSFEATLRMQAELAEAGGSGTETKAQDREERIRELMQRRPRVLWEPTAVGDTDVEAPRRKGKKPGRPKGSKAVDRPESVLRETDGGPSVRRSTPKGVEEVPETSGRSGVNGAPSSRTPRSQPVAEDAAAKASRRNPRRIRPAADAEQLDAFG